MNKHLREAFLKQKARRAIRAASARLLSEQDDDYEVGSVYTTFVQPFTDVVQAANLGAQDFLNSYITYLRLWITWNPKKGEELLKQHDARREKIEQKWKPLMERTEAALSTGEADLIAFAFAPQALAVSMVGSTLANYSGDIKSALSATFGGSLISSLIPGVSTSEYKPDNNEDDILTKVNKLFFAGVALRNVLALSRGEFEDKQTNESKHMLSESKGMSEFKKDFEQFIEDTGIKSELDKTKSELFDSLKEAVQTFEDEYIKRETLFKELEASASLDEFKDALKRSQNVKITESSVLNEQDSIQKIESEIDDSVKALVNSDDFVEEVKKQTNKEDLEMSEIEEFAKKTVFLQSKQSLEEDLGGFSASLVNLRKTMGEQIKTLLPTPAGEKILKTGKQSKELLDFIEKTKQKFFIT